MKTTEQKIADLTEAFTTQMAELKKELEATKKPDLFQIRQHWQSISASVICKRGSESKVQAICNMIAVADYLNGDWVFDPKSNDCIYTLSLGTDGSVFCGEVISQYAICYLKSRNLAQQAIEILGEVTVKKALA